MILFGESLQSNSSQFFSKTESLSIKKSIQVTGLPYGDPFLGVVTMNFFLKFIVKYLFMKRDYLTVIQRIDKLLNKNSSQFFQN